MADIAWKFSDGTFQFYTSRSVRQVGPGHFTESIHIFRVRLDRNPQERAAEKGIPSDWIRYSTKGEIRAWMDGHKDFKGERVEL